MTPSRRKGIRPERSILAFFAVAMGLSGCVTSTQSVDPVCTADDLIVLQDSCLDYGGVFCGKTEGEANLVSCASLLSDKTATGACAVSYESPCLAVCHVGGTLEDLCDTGSW